MKFYILIIHLFIIFQVRASINANCNCAYLYSEDEIKQIEKELLKDSLNDNLYLKLINAYFCSGNYQLSSYYINKVISANPDFGEAYYYKGLILARIYQSENIPIEEDSLLKAISYFFKSIDLNHKLPESYYSIGVIHNRLNEYKSAIFYFNLAFENNLKCYPNTPYVRIIDIYLRQGNLDEAYSYYKRGYEYGNRFTESIGFMISEYWSEEERKKFIEWIKDDSISPHIRKFLEDVRYF